MESLEKKIDYKFRNSLLLAEALTHPSLAYETQKPHFDNQRLEFLGDAVIQLIFTELLYALFPAFPEGKLTKLRSRLVSRKALQSYASRIDLGTYLLMGKGEEANGGRNRPSTLADAFEALVGAIYLDSDYSVTKRFVLDHCEPAIRRIEHEPEENNPKGQLQEILQALSSTSPRYEILSQEGPDHCRVFRSSVLWEDLHLGSGEGSSKKEAEANAARDALRSQRWETRQAGDQELPPSSTTGCEQVEDALE